MLKIILLLFAGWSGSRSIGNFSQALAGDYLDQDVWNYVAANYIAIVRHDDNIVHAVKTFKIIYDQGYSLQEVGLQTMSTFTNYQDNVKVKLIMPKLCRAFTH